MKASSVVIRVIYKTSRGVFELFADVTFDILISAIYYMAKETSWILTVSTKNYRNIYLETSSF
jgi:hypothetical protein